jgi:hypothetical protein
MFSYYIIAKKLKINNVIKYDNRYYEIEKIVTDKVFPNYFVIDLKSLDINNVVIAITVNKHYRYIQFVANTSKELVWINV